MLLIVSYDLPRYGNLCDQEGVFAWVVKIVVFVGSIVASKGRY